MKAKEIIGNKYKLLNDGKVFTVLDAELYPASKVSERYKSILDFKPGMLVAISYRGTLIPNLTMEKGVIRLTKIELKEKVYDRPSTISDILGIKKEMLSRSVWEMK